MDRYVFICQSMVHMFHRLEQKIAFPSSKQTFVLRWLCSSTNHVNVIMPAHINQSESHPIPPSRTRFSPRFLPPASLKCSLPGLRMHSFKLCHFTLVCSTDFFSFGCRVFALNFRRLVDATSSLFVTEIVLKSFSVCF